MNTIYQDRLFAIEPVKMKYDKIIRELVDGLFSREQLMKKFDELEKTVQGCTQEG